MHCTLVRLMRKYVRNPHQLPLWFILLFCLKDFVTWNSEWHDRSFPGFVNGELMRYFKCQLSQCVDHPLVWLRQPSCSCSHLAEHYCEINEAFVFGWAADQRGDQALTWKTGEKWMEGREVWHGRNVYFNTFKKNFGFIKTRCAVPGVLGLSGQGVKVILSTC